MKFTLAITIRSVVLESNHSTVKVRNIKAGKGFITQLRFTLRFYFYRQLLTHGRCDLRFSFYAVMSSQQECVFDCRESIIRTALIFLHMFCYIDEL